MFIADLSFKLGLQFSKFSQVFSNKPDASDKDAVFVVQVDTFASLFLDLDRLLFCPAVEGLTVPEVTHYFHMNL